MNVFVARQLRVNVSKGINIHIFIYALQTLQLAESGHTARCNGKACKHDLSGCFVTAVSYELIFSLRRFKRDPISRIFRLEI